MTRSRSSVLNVSKAPVVKLKSGWIVLDSSTATGGIHYQRKVIREDADGDQTTKVWETTREVDHTRLVKELDGLVKKVDHILRKHCSRLSKFYFADEDQLALVRAAVSALQSEADRLNGEAIKEGCARRAYISVMPTKIDLSHEDAAREVARTITDTLTQVCEMIRAGDVGSKLEQILRLRVKNLNKLAIGFHSQYLVAAFQSAVAARKATRERINNNESPESAGRKADLEDVENAITMFQECDF